MATDLQPKVVSVLGTGNFGLAIGKRLARCKYDVTYGSRRPKDRDVMMINSPTPTPRVVGIREAVQKSQVIVLATRVAIFNSFASQFRNALAGKIIVDVSNRSKSTPVTNSNAEFLQSLLPASKVVKALNVISAYTMEDDLDGSPRVVPVAADDTAAKEIVMEMARDLGFRPYNAGSLSAARDIEGKVTQLFPKWRSPLLCAISIFGLWWLYVTYLYFIKRTAFSWEQIFVKVLNKPVAMTAISLFALTYLPGCLAGFLQLARGTKNSRFPRWLDVWLRSRKQLGLAAFTLACVHTLLSCLLLSPTYYKSWFHHDDVVLKLNMTSELKLTLPGTSWMNWKGELSCLTGLATFLVFSILALTSLPTVGETLNWVEWRFVQSRLGTVGLFLAVSHVYTMGMPSWIKKHFDPISLLQSITFMSSLPAVLVILMKLLLALPCLRFYLRRIRRGWERGITPDDAESGVYVQTTLHSTSLPDENHTADTYDHQNGRREENKKKGCCSGNTVGMVNFAVSVEGEGSEKEMNCGGENGHAGGETTVKPV